MANNGIVRGICFQPLWWSWDLKWDKTGGLLHAGKFELFKSTGVPSPFNLVSLHVRSGKGYYCVGRVDNKIR